ncbi:MAG: response regulator transcription factor [Elusimicrobiota bacterium]|jgi:two-component system alkaline phosphatase synthesis response regulator PhoP
MPKRCHILLVDDEADNRRIYGDVLESEGYAVKRVSGGRAAFDAALESLPDLVLSDVSMPGGDGLTLLGRLRADKKTARVPVVLMSGVHKGPAAQADGLDQGADDYLPKPVTPALIRAKIAAVLRRYRAPEELDEQLKAQGLVIDVAARTVAAAGKQVALTRKEFDLLTTFLRKPGRVLSVPFLLETVWGYNPEDYSDPHTVGVHVSTLRRKIGAKIAARIVAVTGLGYRFEA